jgi:hypothetical protein
MEWFALIIPIIAIIVLKIYFSKQLAWWEFFIPIIAALGMIGIGKALGNWSATRDQEYWGGWVVEAYYYEPWDEEVSCRHPIYATETYSCGPKGEDTCTREVLVGYQHAYDVDDHPAYWWMVDSNNEGYYISDTLYTKLVNQFGNKTFKNLYHVNVHSYDGNAYYTKFNGNFDAIEPTTKIHSYVNKIKASDSIFKFPDVNKKKTFVYDYPDVDEYYCKSVLAPIHIAGQEQIDKINAALGASKKVRIWILVYPGKTIQSAFDQRNYWKGSNKNELVICVGVDNMKDQNVLWANVFSWSKSETLKVELRDKLIGNKLDLKDFSQYLYTEVKDKWVKRNWHDFDYLTVKVPTWAMILIYTLTILSTALVGFWAITNEYDDDSKGIVFASKSIKDRWRKVFKR